MQKRFLECGKVVSTHGIKGEVKLQPWSDSPEELLEPGVLYLGANGEGALRVEHGRAHKQMLLLKLEGYDSIESAATLRGKTLYSDREALAPTDGHFIQDLIGLAVENIDTGRHYGALCQVYQTGANDVYEILGGDGIKRLIPAIRQVVLSIDLSAGKMFIRPLKGLFEDED